MNTFRKANHNLKRNNQRQLRYSIRKLTIGVASCLIGYFILAPGPTVQAAEVDNPDEIKIEEVEKNSADPAPAFKIDGKEIAADKESALEESLASAADEADAEKAAKKEAAAETEANKKEPIKTQVANEKTPITVGTGFDYSTLYDAVNNANAGDLISVEGDTQEKQQIVIDKDLTITGKNNAKVVFEDANIHNDQIIKVTDTGAVSLGNGQTDDFVISTNKEIAIYGKLIADDGVRVTANDLSVRSPKIVAYDNASMEFGGGVFEQVGVVYEKGSHGKITGGQFSNTWNPKNENLNSTPIVVHGHLQEISGGDFINKAKLNGWGGSVVFIDGTVDKISGGNFNSVSLTKGIPPTTACFITDGAHIGTISGGNFNGNNGIGVRINKEKKVIIDEITGGNFVGYLYGMSISRGNSTYYETGNCIVNSITGGSFQGEIGLLVGEKTVIDEISGNPSFTGTSSAGLQVFKGTIKEIQSGKFKGKSDGLLNQWGLVEEIIDGTFIGNDAGLMNAGGLEYEGEPEKLSLIGKITGGTFKGIGSSTSGLAQQYGSIDLISGGSFEGFSVGLKNSNSQIATITGGVFKGNESGLWNRSQSEIKAISGGQFIGKTGLVNDGDFVTGQGIYAGGKIDKITNGVFWGTDDYAIDNQASQTVLLEPDLSTTIGNGRYWGKQDALHGDITLPKGYEMSPKDTTLPVNNIPGRRDFRYLYNPNIEDWTEINQAPVIHIEDKTLTVGDTFDPKKDVTATDAEDGDLTDKIEIDGKVDTSKPGEYEVTYTVTDSQGAKFTKTITVTVNPKMEVINQAPVIKAEDKTLTVGDTFDPKKDVTATDAEDGDLTEKIEIVENTVDTNKAGEYKVTYKVTDSKRATAVKTIKVTVKDKEVIPPIDPVKPEEPVLPEDPTDPDKPDMPDEKDKPSDPVTDTDEDKGDKSTENINNKNASSTNYADSTKQSRQQLPQTGGQEIAGLGLLLAIGGMLGLAGDRKRRKS